MAFHVGVAQVYLACDLPDHAHTKIRLVFKNGGPGLHLLAKKKKKVSSLRFSGERWPKSVHSKSGEAVEIFEACVEGVLPFLQQNIRPRCSHEWREKGSKADTTWLGTVRIREAIWTVIQGIPFLACMHT